MYKIKHIENEDELSKVLKLCYDILGQATAQSELYCYEAWKNRMREFSKLMLYAQDGNQILSLVLGRAENEDSLVCGCVACHPDFRKRGITRSLMTQFENNAREMRFKYITLGAADNAVGFYEKCGYAQIMEVQGQKIFQKLLNLP
ncbi:MAG: GNAT family N-acetyltransferase [Roseburia sp.]|nr:GNAT family N-acetyltransferase [Roseburia sp.]MCM1098492.1 GNAT family N-acetyltransferase [Ruminococcus flavefaciens]